MSRYRIPNFAKEVWFNPRLQRYTKFALSYTGLALIAAVLAIVGFVQITDEVLSKEIDTVNHAVLRFFYEMRSPTMNEVALQLTALGSGVVVPIIGFFFILILLGHKRKRTAISFAIMIIGAGVLIATLKLFFAIARPDTYEPLVKEMTYSFPSGHAVISFTLYGGMAAWLFVSRRKEKWVWFTSALLLVLAAIIALTRVYLGVHWPSDIAAGACIAMFWVSLCLLLERRLSKTTKGVELDTPN
ncbi:MAG TPA: phosphatase PAP2 family protein [Candidatus Kapabacteria bacterium]|nr:phosphatase PAP2 family protein [Candidatus Kapabacteria bacterium]